MRSRAISTIIICTYPFVTYTFTTSTTTSKKFPFIHKYYFDIITILNLWRSVLFIQSLSGWLSMKYFFWIYFWNDSFSFGETIRIFIPAQVLLCKSVCMFISAFTNLLYDSSPNWNHYIRYRNGYSWISTHFCVLSFLQQYLPKCCFRLYQYQSM